MVSELVLLKFFKAPSASVNQTKINKKTQNHLGRRRAHLGRRRHRRVADPAAAVRFAGGRRGRLRLGAARRSPNSRHAPLAARRREWGTADPPERMPDPPRLDASSPPPPLRAFAASTSASTPGPREKGPPQLDPPRRRSRVEGAVPPGPGEMGRPCCCSCRLRLPASAAAAAERLRPRALRGSTRVRG